jgi:hypothetical protein
VTAQKLHGGGNVMSNKFDYYKHSVEASERNEKRRSEAFLTKECQEIYRSIIDYCGGEEVVRPGMLGQIKQYAITCFLKEQVPDFEKFKLKVTIANSKHESRRLKRKGASKF